MNNFTRPFLYGQQPIRRENPAEGQSEWYYLDPRGSDSFADMKTIDVATKDTPNPYAEELQQHWYENDPNSYREFYGNTEPPQVANNNPDLGSFGSAVNNQPNAFTSSRFSSTNPSGQLSTPYWPNSLTGNYVSTPSFGLGENGLGIAIQQNWASNPTQDGMQTDWQKSLYSANNTYSGMSNTFANNNIQPLARSRAGGRGFINNDSNSPFYSNSGDTIDTISSDNHNLTDEELYNLVFQNIKENEGCMEYPYLDSKGIITAGCGTNVENKSNFMNYNFNDRNTDLPATYQQKVDAYKALGGQREEMKRKGLEFEKHAANYYHGTTSLSISDDEMYKRAYNHMVEDLVHLRKEFSDFDKFPLPLKEVLMDIQYNVKGGVNRNGWPHLYQAIQNKDVLGEDGIVNNVHRKDIGQKRNNWTIEKAKSIRF